MTDDLISINETSFYFALAFLVVLAVLRYLISLYLNYSYYKDVEKYPHRIEQFNRTGYVK